MYTAGGFVSPSLKDKFIQRLATDDASESQSIREAPGLNLGIAFETGKLECVRGG